MAQLNSGNLGGGITHTFEFDFNDLQTAGFLGQAGDLTGVTPTQEYGYANQKVVAQIPRSGYLLTAGITTVEATSGASNLAFYCDLQSNSGNLDQITSTNANLISNTEFDNRAAGYSIQNNGTVFHQTVSSLLTGTLTGLNGLTGGTDAANGAAAALALYNNRERVVFERPNYNIYSPSQTIGSTVYMQIDGTIANLTAGRWIMWFSIVDPLSLLNGKKLDSLV
tara:strand:- start:169 stop:840 length:672 start_codon:yes stop_codon:yes gene_type:complete